MKSVIYITRWKQWIFGSFLYVLKSIKKIKENIVENNSVNLWNNVHNLKLLEIYSLKWNFIGFGVSPKN